MQLPGVISHPSFKVVLENQLPIANCSGLESITQLPHVIVYPSYLRELNPKMLLINAKLRSGSARSIILLPTAASGPTLQPRSGKARPQEPESDTTPLLHIGRNRVLKLVCYPAILDPQASVGPFEPARPCWNRGTVETSLSAKGPIPAPLGS